MKVIEVKNISKEYRLGALAKDSIKDSMRALFKSNKKEKETFMALNDISFNVNNGEVLGIVGKNGAGKSTLLKVLSRITEPTSGEIKMRGRVASLLEVGTGFHPELTGRENIFLNGSILGMTKAEIKLKFDEIVEFSGVRKFIDTPVKHYSSGMYVRLAFSVAAHLEPEILIIDEVLAVGDAEFQKKCLGKMKAVAGQGRTVLFVSHNMAAVKTLCSRAILLNQGKLVYIGETDQVVDRYLNGDNTDGKKIKLYDINDFDKQESFTLNSIEVLSKRNNDIINQENDINIIIKYIKKNDELFNFALRFKDSEGNYLFVCPVSIDKTATNNKSYCATMTIPGPFFNEGSFSIDILVSQQKQIIFLDNDVINFNVIQGNKEIGEWMGKTKGPLKPSFNWKFD